MREIRVSPQNPTVGDYRRLEKWKARWRSQCPWVPRVLRVDADTRFPAEVVFSPGHLDATVRNYLLCVGLFFIVSAGMLVAGVLLMVRLMRRVRVVNP